jgi:tellurite resistance protein
LGNLSTPKTVQKLQKALHAKAKAEAGYRFYALYDKITRNGKYKWGRAMREIRTLRATRRGLET